MLISMSEQKDKPPEKSELGDKLKKIPEKYIIFGVIALIAFSIFAPKIDLSNPQIVMVIIGIGVAIYFLFVKKTEEKGHITFDEARNIVYNYMIFLQQDIKSGIKNGTIHILPKQKTIKNSWSGKTESWFVSAKVINDEGNFDYAWTVDYNTGEISSSDEKESGINLSKDAESVRTIPVINADDFYKQYYNDRE